MARHTRIIIAVFASVLLGAAGCATTPPTDLPTEVRAELDNQGVQHAEITAGSYWFRPAHVIVKADVPVVLEVRKQPGVIPHSFVIDAPQAGITVALSLSTHPETASFTPTQPGRYPFYCDQSGLFGNHREKGMAGVLEVVE